MSRFHGHFVRTLLLVGCCAGPIFAQNSAAPTPIKIKVVVVTMFERGEDTGDTPGEFQLWVEREHLDRVLPLAAGYHHVRLNKDGVLGLLTRVGTANRPAIRPHEGVLAYRRHRRRRSRGRIAWLGSLGEPRN